MIAIIPGQPIGKQRPRLSTRGGFARAYTPAPTVRWEKAAAAIMAKQPRDFDSGAMVTVRMIAVMKRPQRLLRKRDPDGRMWCDAKPDVDNVAKALLDSAVRAGVIDDDKQVVALYAAKMYAARNEEPRLEIEILDAEPLTTHN